MKKKLKNDRTVEKQEEVLQYQERREKRFSQRIKFEKIKPVLVLVFVPVFFTILFSAIYSNVYVQELPIAILDLDHSSTSRTIIQNFEKSTGFRVAYYVNTQEELKKDLLSEEIETGLIIPEGFEKEIKKKLSPSVLMLMDGTNIVIANNAYSYASTILGTISAGIELQYLQGGGIVQAEAESNLKTLTFADRILFDPQLGYFTFTFAGFLAIFIQQTFLSVMGPEFVEAKCKRESTGNNNLVTKLLRYTGLNVIGGLLCILAAHYFGHYPLHGNIYLILLLQIVFIAGLIPMLLLIASFLEDKATCAQFVMFMSIPTLLTSGYVWPVFNMPHGFLSVLKWIWPMYYYVLPIREVMLKGAGVSEISQYLVGGITFALVWLPISYLIFRMSGKVLKNKLVAQESCK